MNRLRTFSDVVDWGLCIGCGACAYACRDSGARMVHVESEGFRPVFDNPRSAECHEKIGICPGYQVDARVGAPGAGVAEEEFGSALEIWEGWAADPEIRFRGSSGGVLSALSLYCVEAGGFDSVVHAGMDPAAPWMNRNHFSRTRDEVLARAGSRYAPSAPVGALAELPGDGRHVFVGKPCDAAALKELVARDSALRERIGLVMTFFCAGTPSTRGTLDLLQGIGAAPDQVDEVHYRGEGWPGRFRARKNETVVGATLSYEESWGRLTAYRPLRCNLCPDGLGRLADLACGDAWGHYADDGNPGRSLVVVRTERGRRILEEARRAGYVTLRRAPVTDVTRAQQNLLERRRALFGRLLAFRLAGAPVPRYPGFSLLRAWILAGPRIQIQSFAGTLRRVVQRRWFRRRVGPRPAAGEIHGAKVGAVRGE